jgi:hypothetical protein
MTALGPTSLWSIKDQVEMIGNPENAAIDTHEQQDRLKRTCKKNQTGKCSKEPTCEYAGKKDDLGETHRK